MAKAEKTLIQQLIGAGFSEVNKTGEAVKGTDYTHGWNSLDGRKRHLYLTHKNGKRIEMELVPNGGSGHQHRIVVLDGEMEIFKTTEGKISEEDLKYITS